MTPSQSTLFPHVLVCFFSPDSASLKWDKKSYFIIQHVWSESVWLPTCTSTTHCTCTSQRDIDDEWLGIRTTRVYIVLLLFGAMVLVTDSALTRRTRTVIMKTPSIDTFEQLISVHADTLICPCSKPTIPHEQIYIFRSPHLHPVSDTDCLHIFLHCLVGTRSHFERWRIVAYICLLQICSSPFLKPVWLDGYFKINFADPNETISLLENDFRANGAKIFHLLSIVCQWINDTITSAQSIFIRDELVTIQTISSMLSSDM